MIRAWQKLLTAQRKMDAEIAEPFLRDLTVVFVQLTILCDKYSFENYPDVSGLDLHIIMKEMDMYICAFERKWDVDVTSSDDADIYDSIREALS